MSKEAELYREAIVKHLKTKYNFNDDEIKKLILDYSLDDLTKNNPNYFYYESPECWAEFLIPLL